MTLHNANINGQTITVSTHLADTGLLFLYENDVLIDSANINNGVFAFYKQYPKPTKLTLTKPGSKGYFVFLYIAPQVKILLDRDQIWKSKVLDSNENDIFRLIRSAGNEFNAAQRNSFDSVDICRELGDTLTMNRLYKVNHQATRNIAYAWYRTISEHVNSYAAINCFSIMFNNYYPSHLSIDTMFLLYQKFPASVLNCKEGKTALHYFKVDSLLKPGIKIIDFHALTPNDSTLSVSLFRGKYLLIDYWASWCGPCRLQAKQMLPIYLKYNNMGFDILGFSLDKEKKDWIKAIYDDNIPWPQISDLKGKNSEITAIYNVSSIPFTILIDPDGKVIKSKLNAIDLENELVRIFGK